MWPDLWVKVSGEVVKDAAYLHSLRGVAGGYAARQRELKRLAVLYGAGYRMDVERVLRDGPGAFVPSTRSPGRREAALAEARAILERKGAG